MAGIDIYFDPTGVNDIVFDERGDFRWTQTLQESIAQRVKILLTTWQGEWNFNLDFGTPYEQRLLTGSLSQDEIASDIKRVVLDNVPEATRVSSIVTNFDRDNRIIELVVEVYCDNEKILIPVVDPQKPLNIYPEPRAFEEFVICSIPQEDLEATNRLHYHINYELPFDGTSTWWKVPVLTDENLTAINNLHQHVNYDLPEDGDSTWIKDW